MSDGKSKKRDYTLLVAVIAGTVAIVSTAIGVVAQFKISDLDKEVQREQIDLGEAGLQQDQREHNHRLIESWLPGLMDPSPDVRARSRSLLLVLLPNDAERLFQEAQRTLESLVLTDESTETAEQAEAIGAELEQAGRDAQDVVEELGDWVIVVGADDSVSGALNEVQRSKDASFQEVEIILRDGKFRTVLFGFTSEDDTIASLSAAQVLIRESAGVRSLGTWLEGDYAVMPNIYDLPRQEGLDALEEAGFTNVDDFKVDSNTVDSAQVREVVLNDGLPAESENEIVDETGVLVSRLPLDTPLVVKIAA